MEDTVRNPQRLTSLPFDILSQILTHVNSSDIPTLKLTIFSAMMTRQFWYNCIHRLCKEHFVSAPEEELEEYTITELERWVLRRIPVRSDVPTKLKIRYLLGGPNITLRDMTKRTLLIPGGRWLLVNCWRDSFVVYFFDLDSSDLKLHQLLNPRDVNPCITNHSVAREYVWIDREAPRLSFRFAGYVAHRENDLLFFWVYIYRVNLIGHGASATLVAQIIATFRTPTEETMRRPLCTFNSRYFIRGLTSGQKLEVFDYKQALGCFDSPLIESHTVRLEGFPQGLEFINKDIFAVHCLDQGFYHMFNIESSTSIELLREIYKLAPIRSRICWTPEASLMTLIEREGPSMHPYDEVVTLQGLVIPHDGRLHPRTVELGKYTRLADGYFKLGIFISLSYSRTDEISYINHEWDYTSPTSSDRVHTIPMLGRLHNFQNFDEDTGRSIRSKEGLYVVDIVLAG